MGYVSGDRPKITVSRMTKIRKEQESKKKKSRSVPELPPGFKPKTAVGKLQKSLAQEETKLTAEETVASKLSRSRKIVNEVTKPGSDETIKRITYITPVKGGKEIRIYEGSTTQTVVAPTVNKPTPPTFMEMYYDANAVSVLPEDRVTEEIRNDERKIIGYRDPVVDQGQGMTLVSRKQLEAGGEFIYDPKQSERAETSYQLQVQKFIANQKKAAEEEKRRQQREYENNIDYSGFTERSLAASERSKKFREQEGFKRIQSLGDFIGVSVEKSFVPGTPSTDKPTTFVGKTTSIVSQGLMGWPIALGGTLPSIGATVSSTVEGYSKGGWVWLPTPTIPTPIPRPTSVRTNIEQEYGRAWKSLGDVYDPRKPSGAATYITAGLFATTIAPSMRTARPVRWVMKFHPKYVPLQKTGITFVEAHSIETPLAKLKSMEGAKVTTIHTTTSNLFSKSNSVVLKSQSGVGGFRAKYDLYHFYKSSPLSFQKTYVEPYVRSNVKVLKPGESLPNNYVVASPDYVGTWQPVSGYFRFTSQPTSYLAYAGIGKGTSFSSSKVVPFKPTVRLLIGKDVISATTSNVAKLSIKDINMWQGEQSGGTFVPAENIVGASVEGQFITPTKYVEPKYSFELLGKKFRFGEKPIEGYESFQGSILEKTGREGFTYYKQTFENPFTSQPGKVLWDVFGKKSQYYKLELIGVKTKPVTPAELTPEALKQSEVVDLAKYNKEYYEPTKYYDVGEISSKISKPSSTSSYRLNPSITSHSSGISYSSLTPYSIPSPVITPSYKGSSPFVESPLPPSPIPPSPSPSPSIRTSGGGGSQPPSISSSTYYTSPSTTSRTNSYTYTLNPPPTPTYKKIVVPIKIGREQGFGGQAFAVDVKRAGKWFTKSVGLSRKGALGVGSRIVTSGLGASFRIRPVSGSITSRSGEGLFGKYRNQFRDYKIVKGKKVPLQDVFIQRKGFRLGTRSEVSEIQLARRMSL